ncbi:MAG: SH3 domain [Lasallia pustulata]|uniref:SH3 domain n=1 Tax=Lasallia pustulata TaxID=136370 RepID=A0A5M8PK18_9LECA|nr:MAG: SH3 domain [Lasallia pustulata]
MIALEALDKTKGDRERVVILGSGWAGYMLSRKLLIKAVQEVYRVKVPDRTETERSNTECITPLLGATDTASLSRPPGQPPASIVTAAEIPSAQRALHPQDISSSRPTTSSSSLVTSRPRRLLYPEPSIACERCGKPNIEYELHKNCSACKDGNFNLCLRCYRLGLGCLHWFGFGYAVWLNYERQGRLEGYPPNRPQPYTLTGRRYMKPKAESIQLPDSEVNRPLVTCDNPAKRLQAGNFCSNCSAFSNDCFWKCDACNGGGWGFCTGCIDRGKCCNHALLPIVDALDTKPRDQNIPTQQTSPRSASASLTAPDAYKPLAFSSTCSLCRYPIQPSSTRFHCLQCDDHASDICTPCYLKLVSSGRISPEIGDKGWRRCLRGHRMIIVGFEDSARGQRHIVVKDRVGGCNLHEGGPAPEGDELWTWRDGRGGEASMLVSKNVSARAGRAEAGAGNGALLPPILLADMPFPPSGGVGMRVMAQWAFWPREGVEDELGFPKGADVVEAEDENGDWWIGRYCGKGGLVPGNYWD